MYYASKNYNIVYYSKSTKSYSVSIGMNAQITEQTRDAYRGGGSIPAAMPRLRTSSKYSCAAMKAAAEIDTVNIQPPANTMAPPEIPMPSPKIILFFN